MLSRKISRLSNWSHTKYLRPLRNSAELLYQDFYRLTANYMHRRERFIKKIIKFTTGNTAGLTDVLPRYLVAFNGWLHGSTWICLDFWANIWTTKLAFLNSVENWALKQISRIIFISRTKFNVVKRCWIINFFPRERRKLLI